jgi:hypothetical protein
MSKWCFYKIRNFCFLELKKENIFTFRMCFRGRADDHVFVEDALEVAGEPVDDAVLFHLEVSDLVPEI